MAIYTVSDLHLSFGADKPMDIFGGSWQGHERELEYNWRNTVSDCDTVVLPGDHSWALRTCDAAKDMLFIHSLPGTKILLKGNHDLWWATSAKMEEFRQKHGIDSVIFMYNDSLPVRSSGKLYAIAGTRGWLCPGSSEYKEQTDGKIYMREAGRLKASLEKARALTGSVPEEERGEIIVFMHYPPYYGKGGTLFTDLMEEYGVKKCYYGHLHGLPEGCIRSASLTDTRLGDGGTLYSLVSCDYTGNRLTKAAE